MRRRMRAAALVLALALALGTVAAATETTGSIYEAEGAANRNGIQVAPLDSTNCTVNFAEGSEELTVTYTDSKLKKDDMVIVLLLKSENAVTSGEEAAKVETALTAGTIQYIDQADAEAGTVTFRVFPQNYSNGVIRVIWASQSGGVNTATVAAVNRTYTLGDVNRDGAVTPQDALAILMYIVNNEDYQDIDVLAADVPDGKGIRDGYVTAQDALSILLYTVNQRTF